MQTISVRRADELDNAARNAVESLLGRKVADEEQVTVMEYPAEPAEDEPDRKAVVRDLIDDLDSMAASASHIPDEEMEALIDEAMPAASAALDDTSMNCGWPPEAWPAAPGNCTLWVASKTTGQPVSRMIARSRMSTTRFL
jgi:hypothetical protein